MAEAEASTCCHGYFFNPASIVPRHRRSGGALIVVVQSAEDRAGHHRAAAQHRRGGPGLRPSLADALVRPSSIEVRHLLAEHATPGHDIGGHIPVTSLADGMGVDTVAIPR